VNSKFPELDSVWPFGNFRSKELLIVCVDHLMRKLTWQRSHKEVVTDSIVERKHVTQTRFDMEASEPVRDLFMSLKHVTREPDPHT